MFPAMRDDEKALRAFARHNRGHMNDAEVRLWIELRRRALGYRFHRQRVIGRYIVDFVCVERRLVVEVDGSQHAQSERDRERDEYLERKGYRVERFWSWDVLAATNGVLDTIHEALAEGVTETAGETIHEDLADLPPASGGSTPKGGGG
jgi:very-short-patch-repair endonuclease